MICWMYNCVCVCDLGKFVENILERGQIETKRGDTRIFLCVSESVSFENGNVSFREKEE